MPRIWVIAPYNYDNQERFKKAWGYCQRNDVIAIGWHLLGNLSGVPKNEIKRRYEDEEEYSYNKRTGKKQKGYQNLQRFWHDIEPGDIIIARAGIKKMVGTGIVFGVPCFNLEKGRQLLNSDPHPNFISVRWANSHMDFDYEVFEGHRYTVAEIKERHKHWPAVKEVLQGVWDIP